MSPVNELKRLVVKRLQAVLDEDEGVLGQRFNINWVITGQAEPEEQTTINFDSANLHTFSHRSRAQGVFSCRYAAWSEPV